MSEVDVLRARASSIAIEVTSKCNLRCSYCHKSDEVHEALPASNADLADDVLNRLYGQCKEIGVKEVTLSVGGETTFAANWHKSVRRFLDDRDVEAHIVSNFARLFNDDDLTALAKFKAIQISFDSAELAMVRKLRGADLRTITFNITRLRQRARELGLAPSLVVNCTLWRNNIDGIAKLAGFCREVGVDQLLLTEGFVSTEHNHTVPDTLETLTDDDVVLLARQIIAAEIALSDGPTALRLQSHLQLRIGDVLEDVREGRRPQNAAALFHRRRLGISACRQPWQSPLISADGEVWPCCVAGSTAPIGTVTGTATLAEILNSDRARSVRASILEGKPSLPCDGCSFASDLPFEDFVQEIREWQGDIGVDRATDVRVSVWPGLLGVAKHQVTLENAGLASDAGITSLSESNGYGLHRVLFDPPDSAQIIFRMRPKGRRRLRVDLAAERGQRMIGRAHVVAARAPSAEVAMGELVCHFTALTDGWLELSVQSVKSFSHINITLMRDDNAVLYRGDGRSAVDISDLRLS